VEWLFAAEPILDSNLTYEIIAARGPAEVGIASRPNNTGRFLLKALNDPTEILPSRRFVCCFPFASSKGRISMHPALSMEAA